MASTHHNEPGFDCGHTLSLTGRVEKLPAYDWTITTLSNHTTTEHQLYEKGGRMLLCGTLLKRMHVCVHTYIRSVVRDKILLPAAFWPPP